jgi:hypothetical protein
VANKKRCADLDVAGKYEAFTKELVRISFLGLGIYGFLVKAATAESGSSIGVVGTVLKAHYVLALTGILCFFISAGCALFHSFLGTKCMSYQLVILRYFGRRDSGNWDEIHREKFKEIIREKQTQQKSLLRLQSWLLGLATFSLILGALMVVLCTGAAVLSHGSSQTPSSVAKIIATPRRQQP